jgi:glycosyltransferase involved in cell wall biosynthesis
MDAQSLRIAIVTENFLPKIDGVTRVLARLLEHLREHGHQALVIGPKTAPPSFAGARVVRMPGQRFHWYPELQWSHFTARCGRVLRDFRPDVVHLVHPVHIGESALYWAARAGAPTIASYHILMEDYVPSLGLLPRIVAPAIIGRTRWVCNHADLRVCTSAATADHLLAHGYRMPVAVWPRGVDSGRFTPERRSRACRAQLTGGYPDRLIILYLGRLSREKGLLTLAEAFAQADPWARGWHLVLVGDGPLRPFLETRLANLPITFTGYLDGDAVPDALAAADIFAFPSTTETYGLVVSEALAAGVPVVAMAVGGVRDQVQDGVTGLLADPATPGAFARRLIDLATDAPLRARLATAGRAAALRRSWTSAMDWMIACYTSLAATTRAPVPLRKRKPAQA